MRDLVVTGHGDRGNRRDRPLLRTLVGAVLRRTRLDQGRTLAEVARSAKVSMQYLSELERGRKEASSEVLAAVCDALRIELPDLLAEVGRELAGQRPATVIRVGFGPDRLASSGALAPPRYLAPPRRPGSGDIVGLLAA
jgi:transcriptional regulator with XRE-family HTH domain